MNDLDQVEAIFDLTLSIKWILKFETILVYSKMVSAERNIPFCDNQIVEKDFCLGKFNVIFQYSLHNIS